MMEKNRKIISTFLVLTFGLVFNVQAQFQSDFEIKQNFDRDAAEIIQSLKTVDDGDEADDLVDRIQEFEADYQEHSEFLNRVLSPETFEGRVTDLRELAEATRDRIYRIEERGDDLADYEDEIDDLQDDLDDMRARADSLSEALEEMRRSRNAAVAQARNLRSLLNERDEFIMDMVDSIFVAYDDVELATLSPDERRELALELDVDNVLGHIENVVDSNLDFLDTHTDLGTEDYLKLYAVQHEFDRMWDNLGPKLADLYEDQAQRQQRLDNVDEKMVDWQNQVDNISWQSVSAAFDEQGIALDPFDNAQSFYASVTSYLDEQIARVDEDGGSDEEVQRYQEFASLWNEQVKVHWKSHMIDAELLTNENFASIDEKLSEWRSMAQPVSTTWMIWLGLAILLFIVFLVLWLMERNKKAGASTGGGKKS